MFRIIGLFIATLFMTACGKDSPSIAPTEESAVAGDSLVAYSGAAIWNGDGSETTLNQHLIVRDGRVDGIVDSVPEGATVVDLNGRWIVPGFINSHGHVSGRWAADNISDQTERVRGDLSLYARYGVTSVLSLGGAPSEAFAIRDAQDSQSLSHARLWVAGEAIAGNTSNEATAMAIANIGRGVDWIKLRVDDNLGRGNKMPWDAVQATIDVARSAEIPVATHIFYRDDVTRLLEMGTGLIAHSVRDRKVDEEFLQTMLASGVCYVPTLVREVSTFIYAERPMWFDDPFFREAAKQSEIDRVSDPEFMAKVAASPSAAGYKQALGQAKENLGLIHKAGIPVAFGTDSGPAGRFLGYFGHMEFDLMADSGMSPRDILLSATSVAASCLDLDDVGTLERGKWADFIVLNDDPLKDIRAARSINSVYIAGNQIAR